MSQRIIKLSALVSVALAPIMVVSILLQVQFGASLLDYAPAWNDEISHWHQAVSFAEAGFESGYYVLNENPAPAKFSKAYTWGPFPYVYYGLIMRVVGIELYTILLINAATLALITLAALIVVRPTWSQLAWVGGILLTFPSILTYLPATMLEPLHQSVAILGSVGFYFVLTQRRTKTAAFLTTLLLMLAGVMRPTWALLILPLLFLAQDERNFWAAFKALLVSALLIGLVAITYYATTSPYPHSRNYFVEGDAPLLQRIGGLLDFTLASLQSLTTHPDTIIVTHRASVVLIIGMLVGWAIWHVWQKRRNEKLPSVWWEIALHLYNLAAIYASIIVLHNTASGEDFRSMGAHLLFSAILLALRQRRWLVGVMIGVWMLSMPFVLDIYEYKAGNFNGQVRQEFVQYASDLAGVLIYNADAPNSWCNTVTMSFQYLNTPPGLPLAVDPGIGLSHIFPWDQTGRYAIPDVFKAKYLMLTNDDYAEYAAEYFLELIRLPQGGLYRNPASACSP